MLKHRKLLISAALLIAALAVSSVLIYRHAGQPPEAARLLPEGDFILYADLKPVHLFELSKSGPVELEGDYKNFVAETGIQFERDLDEVAMSRRDTPDGRDVESSEIFVGRFDSARLKTYLQKISDSTEQYRDHAIYTIKHEGHLVRVALLDNSRVAVTNMNSPDPIRGVIERSLASPHGQWLLESHYRDVPATSLAWVIDRFSNRADNVQLPGGLSFTFPEDSIAVGSLRYTGSLLLRADVFAQSEDQAKEIVDAANTHISLVRSIGQLMGARGPDKDIKAAFDSIQVEQKKNVAVFTATIPQSVMKKVWSEVQSEAAAPVAPTNSPAPTPQKR